MNYRSILHYFYFIDLFQQSVSLKLQNRPKISSGFGKTLSIGIIIFLFYNFLVSDMITKSNPIVLFQSFETNERPSIFLTQNNFVIAFSLTDENNTIYPFDPSYFTYNIYKFSFSLKDENYKIIPMNSIFCNSSYFNRFPQEFKNLNLSYASCPEQDEIFLNGGWDEEKLSAFEVDLYKCVNSTSSNIICKSEVEIDTFLEGKFMSFWFEQKNFDMQNYKNPISSKLKTYYRGLKLGELKSFRLFLKKTFVKTDDSIIYSSENSIQGYAHESFEYDSGTFQDKNYLFSFVLYSGTNTEIHQRKYQKLFDIIAILGGMLSSLTLLCSIFVKLVIEWQTNELILNKLHVFGDELKIFSSIKPNLICPKKKNEEEKQEKPKNLLRMSLFQLVRLVCKKKRKWSEKEALYVRNIKDINRKLDIIEVLKKLEDIDKIKQIFFNEEQLLLFNSLNEKYIFPLKIGDKIRYRLSVSDISQRKIRKIENYIENIRKGGKDLDQNDTRLLRLVENCDGITKRSKKEII